MRLVFTAGSGLTGAVIRWATWSDVAHVAFELPDTLGDLPTYLDATTSRGVSHHPLIDAPIIERYDVYCTKEQADIAIRWALGEIGKPYDWQAIIGMPLRRDWRSPDCWFCSELVCAACEQAGFPLLRADHLNRITPRDLVLSERIVQVPAS